MAESLFTDIINNLGKSKVKVTGSGSKTGKQQIVGAPKGITSDKETINLQGSAEIPITNNVDFLLDGTYDKFRDNIEYKDNQIFLEDAPSNINRKVGIGINKDGEGFGGYAKYDIDNKKPEFFLGYKKTFAGCGLAEEYYGKDKLDWMENYSDQMTFEEYLRYKRTGSFADGGSTNGSEQAAFRAKVEELMDDGYDFGEAVREAMRQGYKKGKLVIKPPKVLESGDSKAIRELDPEYKGKLINKKTKKVIGKVYTKELNDAFEILNTIIKNKGHVGSLEELGRLAGFMLEGKSGKVNHKRTKLAFELATDQFDELENFKLADKKYPKINAKKFRYLDMVAKSFANYYKTQDAAEAAAHLLPDNMARVVDLGNRTTLEKGFFNIRGKITPADKKFLVERISTLTGNKFNVDQVNELIEETSKVRTAKGRKESQIKRNAKMNDEIIKLSKDNTIQKLLQGDLNSKTQNKILARATKLVDGDISIASRRLFQMAEAMSDTTNDFKDLGIKINNNIANKIISTGRNMGEFNNRYAMSNIVYNYYANVVDKTLNAKPGKTLIGYYQQNIKKLLDAGQSPDEIFSVTASARRGLSPYAIFTQSLRSDVNSIIKGGSIDGALSRAHDQLQNIFRGRTYNQLTAGEKKLVDSIVKTFEQTKMNALNRALNPGEIKKSLMAQYGPNSAELKAFNKTGKLPNGYRGVEPVYLSATEKKNIKLPKFNLKARPSKSVANYKSYDKNLQRAFDESYKKVGYSMEVPKNFRTQKELLKDLKKDVVKVKNHPATKNFKLNSFAGFVELENAGLKLPPAVQNSLSKVVSAGGKVFKALGAASVPLDVIPFVQARNLGIDNWGTTGAKNLASEYYNLPRTLEDLAHVATEEGTWENFGKKKDRFFTYEPSTWGQEATIKALQNTSKEEIIKNITERWRDIGPGRLGINTQDLGLEVENQEGIDNRIKKALEQKEWADSQPKIDEGIGTLVEDDLEEKTLQPQGLYSIIYGSNEV